MLPVTVTMTRDPVGNVTYTASVNGEVIATAYYNITYFGAGADVPPVSAFLLSLGL